jgi:7-keto-8-aminopelargonate synthetase-like enzyme
MSHNQPSRNTRLPAPCIVDNGTIVDKRDMQRLLVDLNRVRYIHTQDGKITSQGEGCILEVFADSQRATLIVNHALYLNVHSFDYLELSQSPEQEAYFDLMQDNRQLRLIPLSNPLQDQAGRSIHAAALEAMVAEVLSASWDIQMDDDEAF